ncbi:PAS domain-containing sensor histidine kinase [Natranaeroarchaeum sulfidigenes]|uniref:histidine kinase n=1 Tax=Natranaeroarchaeum sulfidigenes TaxID=2784880 RepID=A0A897MZ60_9EURY|nr:ATP-binding protein [Natranaeroarchaeum sulfidigenes]QSG04169.1 Signal transduction histidine kinase [Natranaeroarchaeum sulfidigenes]
MFDSPLKAVVDGIPGTVYRRSSSRPQPIERATPGLQELAGLEASALDGDERGWLDIVVEDDRPDLLEAMSDPPQDGVETSTYRIETDCGDERWVRDRFRAVSDERIEGFVVDVTSSMQERRELEAEIDRLEAIFESIPAHVYVKDRDGRHVRVSKHLEFAENVVGKTDLDVEGIADEHVEGSYADDMRVIEEGVSIIDKEEYLRGIEQWNRTSKQPLRVDGEVVGLVGITQRITDRKLTEQELQRRTERLEEFTETLTHDIRNPLNIARGHAELAMETDDQSHLEELVTSLDRANEIIDDVIALSQAEEINLDATTVTVSDVCQDAWRSVSTIDASLSLPERDILVEADRSQLSRVLENLFRNAVKHAASDVSIEVEAIESDGTVTGFAVEDDGPGIPPDERDRVFETNYTIADNGSGVGLSIVADIVEAHGWTISVTDGTEGGARFEITGVE